MAYVYRHIRLDKNEPFYIGIGKDKWYRRAYKTSCKNKHWDNVIAKTDYLAEILFDDVDYEFAKRKEIEFITLYGRKDLGTGTLVNMTQGGDGVTNWSEERRTKHISRFKNRIVTNETRMRQSLAQIGKKQSHEQVAKRMQTIKERGIVITKETREKMAAKLRGRPQSDWARKKIRESQIGKPHEKQCVPIRQYDLDGNFIYDFKSIKEAALILELQHSNISKVLNNARSHTGGFKFKYLRDL